MKLYIIDSKLLKHLSSHDNNPSYLVDNSLWYHDLDFASEELAKKVIISAPKKVSLYTALWHPELSGLLGANEVLTPSYIKALSTYFDEIQQHADYYKQYDDTPYFENIRSLMLVLYNLIWITSNIPPEEYNEYFIKIDN